MAVLSASYLLLMIPGQSPEIPQSVTTDLARPFLWNQDAYWDSLETNYVRARQLGCSNISILVEAAFGQLRERIGLLRSRRFNAGAPIFMEMEQQIFLLGPWIGSCPERLPEYLQLVSDVRAVVKDQSLAWDMNDRRVRETLYRLLYGGRMAVEEVMLQAPSDYPLPALAKGRAESSSTPRGMLRDLEVHSGDILLSRGGAPTSALIARGNDFPGNFSHVALVHVDEATGVISIVESHIERGVAIATPEEYFRDTKLRVMVVRLRSSLPRMTADPQLPHRAASYALDRARGEHIPYDFAMDAGSNDKLFCSELVSEAYGRQGVTLWMGLSHITSMGLRQWLADFGVTHFETQEPSDLEYDPQLGVVAEWRDIETLQKDHIDNAATEVLLERADAGMNMGHNPWMLPVARVMKAYSALLNAFDLVGPIPEGMTPRAALKHRWYTDVHASMSGHLIAASETFKKERGYSPPYWEYLRLARLVGPSGGAN